ncbi:MAG: cytochrome c family protein [Myxococcales bacterium]|nr:cytochrome c family protein [Myxococcales bacterium]
MIIWVLVACSGQKLTVEELRDPAACADCHPDHHREWSGSMHAYASEDPVFRALNERGQEETGGELGDFCVKCHAPMAVELGLTTDGTNLDEVPDHLLGVTCYYCHQVDAVEGEHNNPLRIAGDALMRGGIPDPVDNKAHDSAYSPLLDRGELESSDLCGSCHDIVTPLGAHIERTYSEWQGSLFSDPLFGLNCGSCHMKGRDGVAADAEDTKLRRVHDHSMPGVDIALTPFPEREAQRAAVEELLDDTVVANLCVQPPAKDATSTAVIVYLDNAAAGHSFPSGATADRRVWLEIEAFADGERIWSSGVIGDDEAFAEHVASSPTRVNKLHSTLFDEADQATHFFWETASIDDDDLLVAHTTLDTTDPAYVETVQVRPVSVTGAADRIRMSLKVRPLPLDLVDELIDEGRLDPAIRSEIPTFTLAPTVLEWTAGAPVNTGNLSCVPEPPVNPG